MSRNFSEPPPESLEFARLLREHQAELIDRFSRHIIEMAEGTYASVPFEEVRSRTAVGFEALHRSFAKDLNSYATFWETIGRDRVKQGYTIKDTQDVISAVRHVVSEFIAESYADDLGKMLTLTRLADDIHDSGRVALSVVYISALEGAIAKRERAEEALAYERDLLHTLMDNMPDFIFFKDAQARFIRTNKAHAQMMGLAGPQETVGKTDFDFFPREDAQRFYDEEQRIMQSRQPVMDRVWHIPGSEGEIIWVSESKIPLIDATGQVVGLVGISRDITERKQAEVRARLQQDIIESQRQAIQELSTPIVPVLEGVLVLPLVGSVDTRRAQQIMESLLEAIGQYQTAVVIVDITGVPVVDTGVAHHLLQVTRAAALLGAECVLVGISPEVAQTIVSLGVDLSSIVTQANLQSGIEYALKRSGWRIVTG